MPRKKKQLNQNLIDQWPEIFEEIDLTAIPISYLHSVLITFDDGDSWNIVLKKEDKANSENFSNTLSELFNNYESKIKHVDFRLDTDKIKRDVIKTTKQFFKRKK